MTRSALLASSAVALTMACVGSAADAKNMPEFMNRGKINATLPLVAPLRTPADHDGARLVLRYERGFTSSDYLHGVTSFSNPSTGVYCVKPTEALPASANPQVTLEWSYSSGFSFIDFWENQAFDCAAGDLEVRTYDASGNLTENSAFVLTVPR